MTMNTGDTGKTDSRHWVNVPGWPRAHTYSDHGLRLLVLTDEFDTGSIDHKPSWLIVCGYCRSNIFVAPKDDIVRKLRKGIAPSCGCRKPGHENYQGDYKKIRAGRSV